MVAADLIGGQPAFPATVERGLTAVTQCRVALLRAHRELTESLEVIAFLREPDDGVGGSASERAWELLRAAALMEELDELRDALIDADDDVADIVFEQQVSSMRLLRARMSQPDGQLIQGEQPPITERIIVAPAAGRLHRRRLAIGRRIEVDGVIGEVRRGDVKVLIRSPVAGTFLRWQSTEGATVEPGRPLACLRPLDA